MSQSAILNWKEKDRVQFFSGLKSMSAVLFGADRDGGFSARARSELAPALENGAILYVPCDRGAEEAEACSRAGIRMTPTLIAGGESVPGATLKEIVDLTMAPEATAKALGARGFELYGRDSCVWTRRQKAVLGNYGAELIPYINCEDGGMGEKKCASLNIDAVPTWGAEGGRVLLPGYRNLSGLSRISKMSSAALSEEGKASIGGNAC